MGEGVCWSRLRVLWLSFSILWCTSLAVLPGDYYADLPPGPYCGSRSTGCCPGRIDDCSAPILGTLCYCDEFCNRTRNEDCCPDFWTFCKGMEAPLDLTGTCYLNGKHFQYRESAKINCKTCTCQESLSQPGSIELVCEQTQCMIESKIVSSVNSKPSLGWRASNYTFFWGRSLQEGMQYRLGTLNPRRAVEGMIPVRRHYDQRSLPRSFNARTKWPGWIGGIEDQGWCGSSWAVSTSHVASDRLALMSQGEEKIRFSAQQLLDCNSRGQQGCRGGHLDRAWLYMRKYGVVESRCYPYASGSMQHTGRCKVPRKISTLSQAGCEPLHQMDPPRRDLYRTGPAYLLGSEHDIMYEIMESGPVQATMNVYPDFFMYRGGIYRHSDSSQRPQGYHSVRILGWGEEIGHRGERIKYWLAANTWGSLWGENGYFKIHRGVNECEIESYVLGVWAHTSYRGRSFNTFPPPRAVNSRANRIPNDASYRHSYPNRNHI